jgi:hypothetical protein
MRALLACIRVALFTTQLLLAFIRVAQATTRHYSRVESVPHVLRDLYERYASPEWVARMRGSGRLPGCEYGVFGSTEDVLRRRMQEADAAVAARVASIARTGLDAVELEVKEHLEEHLDDFVIQMSHAYKGCIQNGRMVLVPRSHWQRFDGLIWHRAQLPDWYDLSQRKLKGPRWCEFVGRLCTCARLVPRRGV